MTRSLTRTYITPVIGIYVLFIVANVVLYFVLFPPIRQNTVSIENPNAPKETEVQTVVNAPLGADWVSENSVVIQRADITGDIVRGTGIIAERFTVSMDIMLPEGITDAGGGIVFHMPARDDFANAQMIRIADGGRGIMWGYFNAERAFQGEGGAALDIQGQQMTLTIAARAMDYDILVNGVMIAQNLPLHGTGGYIGYISYRGPITFSNFVLNLTA